MNPNRRRLSVSRCDPVGANGASGSAASELEDVEERAKQAGLHEVFSSAASKRAVSVTSITDENLKARPSFANKDEEMLYPKGAPSPDALDNWLKERGVSWCCKKGKKPESPNQDSFSVLVVEDQFALYGVFDGHGPLGHDVSDLARKVAVQKFLANPVRDEEPEQALHDAFLGTQEYLVAQKGVACETSGTTCTLVYHRFAQNTITVAHVGDSRSVLILNNSRLQQPVVKELTVDHKPNLPEERKRIENANPPGRVVFDGYFNHRVFAQGASYPGLNMSRAMGDLVAHSQAGLTAMPDTITVDIGAEREAGFTDIYLVVCTDGVWEFIDNGEAAHIALQSLRKQSSSVEALAAESWKRWMQDSEEEISDDITAVMIRL